MNRHFSYYFMETKDKLYYLENLPGAVYNESFGGYLSKNEEILLIDKSEKGNDEYVKAYRMPTEKIISYGSGYSVKSYSDDEMDAIAKKGVFKGKPLYKIV